jgi:glutamate-ammonia-ligase adenylyltransferase
MSAADQPPNHESLKGLPAPLRRQVSLWFERLQQHHPQEALDVAACAQTPRLARLIACSEFAGRVVIREWNWFRDMLERNALDEAPDFSTTGGLFEPSQGQGGDDVGVRLRRSRDRHLVHILWRDLNCDAELQESLSALSGLADGLIRHALDYAATEFRKRFGDVIGPSGEVVPLLILAMGKLGGRELNFSSDVDLIFLHPEDGTSDGARSLSAHQYFTRLSRQVIGLLDEVTEDGFVYRVDTRLRPFGDSGPPVVNFAALESYLLQHGRSWERYAYVKARVVGQSGDTDCAGDLMQQIIVPFVYRRYLDYGVFESLRDMKAMISAEVQKREMASNIKLGPGGIREIEFIVQSMQLVRGGSDRGLRTPQLRPALLQLVRSRVIASSAADELLEAYRFLRRLENFIQAVRDQQTHDLPRNELDQARLAYAMGMPDWLALVEQLSVHRDAVSAHFAQVAFRAAGETHTETEKALLPMWVASSGQDDWQSTLESLGYEKASELAEILVRFGDSPAVRRLDAAAAKRVAKFMPALLLLLRHRPRPDRILRRALHIVGGVLRRSAYVALLNENPDVLKRLVSVCENSAYLAEEVGRFPQLLDEMLDPRLFSAELTVDDMDADLDERLGRLSDSDSESKVEVLAQFQRATLFRIAIADFSGSLPLMKVSDRLTQLAEIVLQRALEFAWSDMTEQYGEPVFDDAGVVCRAGFGIVAYGKLGGMELSYRSDLDLVFLHDSAGVGQQTDGDKQLDNSRFFGRVVRRLVHFLTTQTGSGAMYEVDTRLRPSGRSGLLVSSVEAFERYQEENAWTWEHQALLRSRPVAGSAAVAREFERVRAETLRSRVRQEALLADVLKMRRRMREQLDLSDASRFDLKQGRGGIGDIEFLVQYLVLRNAAQHPALVHYSDNIRQLGTLQAAGILDIDTASRLQQTYRDYRLRLHRLSLDEQPPLVPETEFVAERQFVVATWDSVMAR